MKSWLRNHYLVLGIIFCVLTNVVSIFCEKPAFGDESKMEVEQPKTDLIKKDVQTKEEIKTTHESYFYDRTEALSFRLGTAPDFRGLNHGDNNTPWLMGMDYTFDSSTWRHFEVGVDLYSSHKLYLIGGYKFIYDRTEDFRPYLKIGASMRFDQGDHLETPFDPDSYALMVAMGAEDLLIYHQSLRLGLEFYGGGSDFMAVIFMGYSWGL
jgi:hypothetical protein